MKQEMIEEVKKACQVMSEGGVILYPTDTVWGLGCDATNEAACQRVLALKNRPENKSFNSIPNLQNNQVLVQSLAIYCILQLSPLLIMNRF